MVYCFIALISLILSAGAPARAEDLHFRRLLTVTSDQEGVGCELKIATDRESAEVRGLQVDCTGEEPIHRFVEIQELKAGAVLFHNKKRHLDVVTLKFVDFDLLRGGDIEMTYLVNGLTKAYKKFVGQLIGDGVSWTFYSSDMAGKAPFNSLHAKKRTILLLAVGVAELRTSWK